MRKRNYILSAIAIAFLCLGGGMPQKLFAYTESRAEGEGLADSEDRKAPELTAFSLEGDTQDAIDGMALYRNGEGAAVTVRFTIDDDPSCWNPSALDITVYDRMTGKPAATFLGNAVSWTIQGRIHSGSFAFDGEKNRCSSYYVALSYSNLDGNGLISHAGLAGDIRDGTYTGKAFMLDQEAPVFHITYNPASRLVLESDPERENDQMGRAPTAGYTAYYKEAIRAVFSIKESCAAPIYGKAGVTGLKDFLLSIRGREDRQYAPEILWTQSGDILEGTFLLTEEDRYTISIKYKDLAANPMTDEGGTDQAVSENGEYTSTTLVIDQTPPLIRLSCVDASEQETAAEAIQKGTNRAYFSHPICLKIDVEDENMRCQELKDALGDTRIFDSAQQTLPGYEMKRFLETMDGSRIEQAAFTWQIPLTEEANYDFSIRMEDLAGNEGFCDPVNLSVDMTKPELELSYEPGEAVCLDAVNYREHGYVFADGRLTVTISAKDKASGVRQIKCTVTGEDGKEMQEAQQYAPSGCAVYQVELPQQGADFKGMILAEALDWAGNRTELFRGHITESKERHIGVGSIVLTTETQPSRSVGGEDYYNTDVKFSLAMKDWHSGLKSLSYSGGSALSGTVDYKKEAGTDLNAVPTKEITYEYEEDFILDAASNNANNVSVKAQYEDNAGHVGTIEQFYQIDVTPPEIEVEYDLNNPSNERFYAQPRTASVKIRERNFDPADVDFIITGTDGAMPTIGEWRSSGEGDDMTHVCDVIFFADGDYTFTAAFEDLAGNQAEYSRVDEFTIDTTGPEMTVAYDNDEGQQGIYYAQPRTASIDILEHNFDASLIEVTVTSEDGTETPGLSGWRQDGDHHVAMVRFFQDGAYTLTVSGRDQADNPLAEYEPDSFVIDATAPTLEIRGIENRSANRDAVMPEIFCSDTNYDDSGTVILLTGCLNGVREAAGERTADDSGMRMRLHDFPYTPETDDLYTMKVTVRDLAGNVSEASVDFSVNRFGSVYTLEGATERLAGTYGIYYTNREQDIIVTETNVDTLEFREITCNLDGKLHVLEEGADYTVKCNDVDSDWKQYTYTVDKHNFAREGSYVLTIYSEDRAKNASGNDVKGKKIAFAVDKTAPELILSGIQDGGQYPESRREVTLDVQDNVCLKSAVVMLNDQKTSYTAAELFNLDGRVTLTAGRAERWQTIRVTAYDAAGNRQDSGEMRFLLTPDRWIQLWMNKPLLYGASLMLSLCAVGGALLLRRRVRFG